MCAFCFSLFEFTSSAKLLNLRLLTGFGILFYSWTYILRIFFVSFTDMFLQVQVIDGFWVVPLINIKVVYLIDDIFCKMHHDKFYIVFSFTCFCKTLFFIVFWKQIAWWCFMVTKLLLGLHCFNTRCELFNSLNYFFNCSSLFGLIPAFY